jgi:hypothetical protein
MKKNQEGQTKAKPAASESPGREEQQGHLESLLEMEGLGQEYWKNVDPDEFVRKLREGWE